MSLDYLLDEFGTTAGSLAITAISLYFYFKYKFNNICKQFTELKKEAKEWRDNMEKKVDKIDSKVDHLTGRFDVFTNKE